MDLRSIKFINTDLIALCFAQLRWAWRVADVTIAHESWRVIRFEGDGDGSGTSGVEFELQHFRVPPQRLASLRREDGRLGLSQVPAETAT